MPETPDFEQIVTLTCPTCGAKGDPPKCEHYQQPWTLGQIAEVHRTLKREGWLMPETPDFESIARAVVPFCLGVKYAEDVKEACDLVAEQLRQIWNARGAADIAKLEAELTSMMGATAAGPYCKNLDRALRTLDRP